MKAAVGAACLLLFVTDGTMALPSITDAMHSK